MMKNMGTVDRIVRVMIAVFIAALYFAGQISGTLAIIFLVVAGILILTSSISFCPLYWPFGIHTNKKSA